MSSNILAKFKSFFSNLVNILLLLSLSFNIYLAMDKYLYPSPVSVWLDQIGIPHPRHRTLHIIQQESLSGLPKPNKIQAYEVKGIVNSLDDPLSEFLTVQETQNFQNNLNQEYAGIGIKIRIQDEKLIITKVFPDSPAQAAGLQAGDEIKKVEDLEVLARLENFNSIVQKIQGEPNTIVNLTIQRGEESLKYTVNRENIQAPAVELNYLQNIPILTINTFNSQTLDQFQTTTNELDNFENKLILDLRSNTGGLVEVASKIADYFVEGEKLLAVEEMKLDQLELFTPDNTNSLTDSEVVILTDQLTASASEILILFLKKEIQATIVGEKTFGKGTVQGYYEFPDQTSLKITVARWLGPNKTSIQGAGIEPDIQINSWEAERKAIEILQEKDS